MNGLPVTPNRELGQHFLADENLLGVIERLADLRADDVALEIGPGLGVLTAYLAPRVRLVHAIEIDRGLEPHLRARLADAENVSLHFGDAVRFDYALLDPKPTKLVANLPYNVATPLVVESLERLASVERWCVMVQREIADRFFAEPRSKAYGAVSVLVQLAAERTGFHAVSREVFRPRPNVDSALVAFRRLASPLAPEEYARVKDIVEGAFAHRRKTLANSLSLAGLSSREQAADALAALGQPRDARAETLSPEAFVGLAGALATRTISADAQRAR